MQAFLVICGIGIDGFWKYRQLSLIVVMVLFADQNKGKNTNNEWKTTASSLIQDLIVGFSIRSSKVLRNITLENREQQIEGNLYAF